MTSTELLPMPRRAPNGAFLSAIVLAACAFNAGAEEMRAPSTVKPLRAESRGHNPAFYEVLGKRYQVRTSSDGYRERGIASWYGRPFHGRRTSSGETYDMNEMTAAHTTLPLPTWVEVTNLSNGKRIVVKVNDRGPFVADRVIDLSYAAASALDIVSRGTARVEIRAVAAPTPRSGARALSPSPARARAAAIASAAPPSVRQESGLAAPGAPAENPSALSLSRHDRLFAAAVKLEPRPDIVAVVEGRKPQGLLDAFAVIDNGRRKSVRRSRH
jgi:rare lipoprotein A (peptidoglycan hydrolase)